MELVTLVIAVIPTIPSVENLRCNDSTPAAIPSSETFFAAVSILLKPLAASSNFNAFLSFSRVVILVLTFFSNFELSNCIDTTRSSTVLLITVSPPSIRH